MRLDGQPGQDFARAQSVVLDQVHFSLNADKFQQFIELNNVSNESNIRLERLLALKPAWDKA